MWVMGISLERLREGALTGWGEATNQTFVLGASTMSSHNLAFPQKANSRSVLGPGVPWPKALRVGVTAPREDGIRCKKFGDLR